MECLLVILIKEKEIKHHLSVREAIPVIWINLIDLKHWKYLYDKVGASTTLCPTEFWGSVLD